MGQINETKPPAKEMRVNIDLFVQLKKGTISDYYITGEVLGEGITSKINMKGLLEKFGRLLIVRLK